MLGDELAEALVARGGARSADGARQAISRSGLRSSDPVRFPRAFLYWLDEHPPALHAKALRESLTERPGYARVFKLLLANGGWATTAQLAKAATCLADGPRYGGRETAAETAERLCGLGVIEPQPRRHRLFRFKATFGKRRVPLHRFLRGLDREDLLAACLFEWLRENALVPWTAHSARSSAFDAVALNGTYWDVTGRLYLGPFSGSCPASKSASSRIAYLMADVVAARTYRISDVESVRERVLAMIRRRSPVAEHGPLAYFPASFALRYSKTAFRALKEAGVLPLTVRSVMGRDADEVLRKFTSIESRALEGERLNVKDLEDVLDTARYVQSLEGLLGNLRGDLFPAIVAEVLALDGYDVERERLLRDPARKRALPVDIVATKAGRVTMIECKGHEPGGRDGEAQLRSLFRDRCELAASTWTQDGRPVPRRAIYITTGSLSPDAANYADRVKKSHGIDCEVWNTDRLLEVAERAGGAHVRAIIEKYYGTSSDERRTPSRRTCPVEADDDPM
jgi:hypothetical protein